MGCSRPLIFPANAGKAPPSKEEEGESPVHSSLPQPRDLDFPPFRRGRGAPTFGFASFTRREVVLNAEDDSEQNRLSPPPLTVNDASEGFFLFVIK